MTTTTSTAATTTTTIVKDKAQLLFELKDSITHNTHYARKCFLVEVEAIVKKTGLVLGLQSLETIQMLHKKYVSMRK